jgi:hypothetical protein
MGKSDRYYELLPYYESEVKRHGVRGAISSHIPHLLHGLSAAAFHGLIHLGYGYSIPSDRLVSEGLAYLHASLLPLSLPFDEWTKLPSSQNENFPRPIPYSSFRSCLLSCFSSQSSTSSLEKAIQQNLSLVPESFKGFQRGMTAVSLSSIPLLNQITADASSVFAVEDSSWFVDVMMEVFSASTPSFSPHPSIDFFLLHGVTSSWALSQLTPLLSEGHRTHAHYSLTNALYATYVNQGCPPLHPIDPSHFSPLPSWEEIIQEALSLDLDEHKYKLVQIAWERGREEGEAGRKGMLSVEMYKVAAMKAIRLPFVFGPTRL